MKTVKYAMKMFFAAVLVAGLCVPALADQPPKPIPDQYIVMMNQDKLPPAIKGQSAGQDRQAKVKAHQAKSKAVHDKIKQHLAKKKIKDSAVKDIYSDAVSGYSAKLNASEVAMLKQDPDVSAVMQDFEVSLSPMPVSTVAPSDYTSGGSYYTCAVSKAGGPVNSTGKATWIWILDTGINVSHPDLNVNAAWGTSFIAGQTLEDGHGHGTHCAGIAAAKMNNIGPTGVSAGATVVPVKVLSNAGSGSFSGILAGLNWVAARDIPGDVVSMSIGCYPVSNCVAAYTALNTAIFNLTYYGTSVVMAAGNDGDCAGAAKNLPGCIDRALLGGNWYPMAKAYTVGAVDCNLVKAPYSNWGAPMDWVAVGSNVWSTYKYGGYATMSGTSMATPVVAGVIHARNGNAPASGGAVNACGITVPLAHR